MKTVKLTVSALAVIAASASVASARDQLQIAGSSTVLPYATIVAEAFAENTDFAAPVVEGGGSSAGLKQFCEGVGENTIDIANASRAIRDKEVQTCADNGVANIIEVQFGYDGIVFASDINGADFALTPSDVFLALAKEVVVDGAVVENTATNWSDVNADLPEQEILAFIPGTKHGTREVFEEKVLLAGCEETGAMEAFVEANGGDEDAAEGACMAVRTDGRSVDIDGDYTETLARIESNANGMGVFGLSFYENNTDKLKVATINDVSPSVETVSSGEYPVSRPLFFYIKKDHIGVIPGLKEYAEFFVSDAVAGPGGPLSDYGLVPDPALAETQQKIADEATMQ
ncbi:substrate-binding domain-containing protein [Paracoccus sp. SCSIO 75233]|uniref:substrate-binding domain-containing protein n=1 Tax=Paracoccus sp. SCSIO 75233 TaxID=3017782 RepID=UPI0022F0F520|nr:substrate-binding domain-containing protein [Paracoccus sp. SCSIO 75233]WBU53626.1 substrate-binding domain-containing protein [Paracoccus sp. SCSIO 75233]